MSAQGQRLVAVGLVAVLLLATVGCGSILRQREHQQRMDELAAEVQADLAAHPEVTEVSVGYSDHIQAPGPMASASITIRSGADPDSVVSEAVRLIWLSELTPLINIVVSVQDATTNYILTNPVYDPEGKDQAQLESRYGPRPSEQSG